MGGRVSEFTWEIGSEVCDRLAQGEPLTVICQDAHMPSARTIHNWRNRHPEFGSAYDKAKDEGYDTLADKALIVAETPLIGEEVELDREGNITKTKRGDNVARSKLVVWTILQLLAKWSPRYRDTANEQKQTKDGLADRLRTLKQKRRGG